MMSCCNEMPEWGIPKKPNLSKKDTIERLKLEISSDYSKYKRKIPTKMRDILKEVKTEEERNLLIQKLKNMEFKKPLPKRWEDLESDKGYFIDDVSNILSFPFSIGKNKLNFNVFKTKKQAKKALAMAKLSQLMDVYNEGWVPDWTDFSSKYCIVMQNREIEWHVSNSEYYFLAFKTDDLRDQFMKNFEEDIKIFFEL